MTCVDAIAPQSMKLLQRIPALPGPFRSFADAEIEQSIPQRFEQQARAFGDRPAVVDEHRRYDYRSLNETANRLARAIVARSGNAPEPVVLLFDHGADVLAAILAVLKAGKFYVVLDPRYPADRLSYMLDDCGARLVVADAGNAELARQLCGASAALLGFDDVDPRLPATDLGSYPAPDSLAMILYTSGSTGRPKGVMHSHGNVLVDVRNFTNGWGITERDRWVLATSISFANSVRTIYGALLNGSAVYPFDVRKGGFGKLAEWLRDHDITIIRNVPTFFRNFMATLGEAESFPAIRVLSLGGEPMLRDDLAYFNRHFASHCVLSHAFGPTECLTVCWALIPHGTTTAEGKLPIGHSLRDKDVLLLDASRRRVDDGEIGEIAVRSRHISPGYWRDTERTQQAFMPDPDGSDARVYLTGDFGRRDPAGYLVHEGRRDFQVKVRGFRVEVSEIENALRGIPGIRDAVVVGRETGAGDSRLIAYYVASATPPIVASQLRERLARGLPDYMIPSLFIAMDAIPQTPNGKTDRLRLPLPVADRRSDRSPAAAASAIESEVAAMWSDILGVANIGGGDSFLDLGGDSLQAARLAARVAARFGVELPVSVLFEIGTVAHMAATIAATSSTSAADDRDSGVAIAGAGARPSDVAH